MYISKDDSQLFPILVVIGDKETVETFSLKKERELPIIVLRRNRTYSIQNQKTEK
jgi:hypothetical protein